MPGKKMMTGLVLIVFFLFSYGCVDETIIQSICEKVTQNTGEKASQDENQTRGVNAVKTLKIRWQRLVSGGQTCPRCGSTEEELKKAISTLRQSLAPLGIEIVLEKSELSEEEFRKNPLLSNQIWLNDKLMEEWIGGTVSESPCCDVCGTSECRTVDVGQVVYESIPADLIVKAGLLAASQLIGSETDKSCCESKDNKESDSGCCPE